MSELLFSQTHEWVRIEGDTATVGISDYAQEQLGEIVYVEFPPPGSEVTQFVQCITIESTKSAAETYAPLSGEVVELNKELEKHPELINESCYEKGWIIKIKIKDLKEKDRLLTETAYQEFIAKEKH